jgi:hypothetical protein
MYITSSAYRPCVKIAASYDSRSKITTISYQFTTCLPVFTIAPLSSRLSSSSADQHHFGPLVETLQEFSKILLKKINYTFTSLIQLEVEIGQHSLISHTSNQATDLLTMDYPKLTKLLNQNISQLSGLELINGYQSETLTQISMLLDGGHVPTLVTASNVPQPQELKIRVQNLQTSQKYSLLRVHHFQKRIQIQLAVVSNI